MRIAVCLKQVPNPDALAAVLRVDEPARRVVLPPGHPMVASPFDEQAIEAALRIRDAIGGDTKITAITLGPESARAVLKQALSLGADDAVHLSDPAFEGCDAHGTATVLAAAVRKLGDVDLVLCGRQAADWDAGVVGMGMAELLGLAAVTYARRIDVDGQGLRVERVLQDGFETIEAPLPALVTVSNELGEVRKPNLRETMRAARKPVAVWSPEDLDLEPGSIGAPGARRRLRRLYIPAKTGACELVPGATPAEQAQQLAERLVAARLI